MEEQEHDNLRIAEALRGLADLVEQTTVKDYDIHVNKVSIRKDDLSGWAHFFKTGDISIRMNFELYNPNEDERGSDRYINVEIDS